MNKLIMSGKSIVTFLLLTVFIGACQPFGYQGREYPSTIGTFNVTGAFTIDPTTILDSLDRGETNVFTPILATPSDDALLPSGSVPWTQSDYVKVVNALSQIVWNEPLDDWLVFFLIFKNTCHDNLAGFDAFEAIYYKPVKVGLRKMYTARYVQIYPLASIVYWAGNTEFPTSRSWAAIDLSKFKIAADDALRIAEENGGSETRVKAHNGCRISVSLPAPKNDNRWDVAYYYSPSFEIIVDPYSGMYEVPTPILSMTIRNGHGDN